MLPSLLRSIFGSRNDRVIKRAQKVVARINALEAQCKALKDKDFLKKKNELKTRLQQGAALDELLPEAFALVREASCRVLGMRHFDVQLIGGIVLNSGNIAEMKTGEGKTLVATLPAYLNALTGKGVHIVTVNDYLTRRDAEWMGKIYEFLGMTTGIILAGDSAEKRRKAYDADITYGTNNELGFDYLRDNLAFDREGCVQRELNFAIVDEVDSILIDEARTPLIISGTADDATDLYISINKIVALLKRQTTEGELGDYSIDEKVKQAYLTEAGSEHVEQILSDKNILKKGQSLYAPANIHILHHVNAAIRAHELFNKDVDYLIKDGNIVIVDEFTGRTMEGRRWSEGLHQAIEAKEGLTIQHENQTLATITYQNYFRLYKKLSGMTGTADTEAHEFHQIYGLEVVVVPTDKKMIRDDKSDLIFLTAKEKFAAIVDGIKDCKKKNQPALVGTISIEISEYLSSLLHKEGIKHQVLNAKFHEKEAEIITQAGYPGTITIATNMAGRGTDIVLGGNYEAELKAIDSDDEEKKEKVYADWKQRHEQVISSGGLHIIGTERHESRRIDNQLRGRSGRQGDPGASRFYLSLEDDLMRIFASDKIIFIMEKLGVKEGEVIESELVARAIENAQRKVEAHNFDIRKHLLEFDDVINEQRKVIYEQRNELLHEENSAANIVAMREDVIDAVISNYIPEDSVGEEWDIAGLKEAIAHEFGLTMELDQWLEQDTFLSREKIMPKIYAAIGQHMEQRVSQVPAELMQQFEKQLMLNTLDRYWKDHLVAMEHLRQGIHLRSFAAKNPKQEYKREAFEMFVQMLDNIKYYIVTFLSKINVSAVEDAGATGEQKKQVDYNYSAAPITSNTHNQQKQADSVPYVREQKKVGRNEPCPCGSGKKYKRCHGVH